VWAGTYLPVLKQTRNTLETTLRSNLNLAHGTLVSHALSEDLEDDRTVLLMVAAKGDLLASLAEILQVRNLRESLLQVL
jgi:hypothetical protein